VLFHVKRDPEIPAEPSRLRSQASALGVELSEGAASKLLHLESLLRERAVPAGMIATGDAARLRERHVLDCLRAAAVVRADDVRSLDLGSGAGLPGLVVAIAVPWLAVTLVERRQRRAAFCELAVECLGLENVQVRAVRIEDLTEEADLCFARALAPIEEAWRLAEPLLREGGRLVYFAGRGARGPFSAPGARCLSMVDAPVLEGSGPLVIMGRQ
jgi:16S rRNA (guanine527-N7)-methyltransferase